MKSLWLGIGGALLIVSGIVLASSPHLFAKEQDEPASKPLNIEISPARLVLQGKPGETINTEIKVRNRNAGATKLKIEIMKLKSEGDTISLETPSDNDDFVKWVTFKPKKTFTSKYDEWKTIPVTIKIPEDAAFTYDYAVVISNAELPEAIPGSTQSIDGKIAIFTLLDIDAPGAVRAAEITRFEASKPWVTYLPVGFETEIKNIGNLHVAPIGNLFIKDMLGRQVATLAVNKEAGYILADGSKTVTNEWADGFPYNKQKPDGTTELVWDWSQINSLRMGKYTADIVLVYNDGLRDIPVTSQTTFWVIPWPILLALLAMVLIVLAGIISFFRSVMRIMRRISGRTKKPEEANTTTKDVVSDHDDESIDEALLIVEKKTPQSKKMAAKPLKVPGHGAKAKKSSRATKPRNDSK